MPNDLKVTAVQVAAAKLKIKLADIDGRQVDPRIIAIANTDTAQWTIGPDGSRADHALPTPDTATRAQVAAARLKIELAKVDGRQVDPRIVAIANARPRN